MNPSLHGKKQVTDCLSHGTAFVVAAVLIIVATTIAAAVVKYSYTKIFYLKCLDLRVMEVGVQAQCMFPGS